MSYLDFRGHKVWYEQQGEGPVALFLHNGGNDHRIWDHQAAYFAGRNRVVLVDHLGYGNSDKPDLEYTLPLYADQVAAIIDHLGAPRVRLVGHCIGAAMSLAYAARCPQRVERAAVFNIASENSLCAGPLAGVYRGFHADRNAREQFIQGLEGSGLTRQQTDEALRGQFGPNPPADVTFEEHIHELYNRQGQMRSLYNNLSNFDSFAAIDRMERPAGFPALLMLWGGANQILPASAAEALRARWRPDRVELLEGCGHLAMREKPGEVNRILDEFLNA
ncbi:MAG: alpha/beta hydrolase [Acidobacteria bacterium]|nr:alpha/beta hydrolase [Acidobacteriota bacterium]